MKKRDFTKTKEPDGEVKNATSSDLLFVVQKHHASHLHYDFRLEHHGVLLSWAVPKGPSLNPSDKRLAMRVEDHPYDYKDFEGVIPKGEYGAGDVIVWDNGTYEVAGKTKQEKEKTITQGLAKGHLSFRLFGKKLRGEFTLIRKGEGNEWMLLKKDDAFAKESDIRRNDHSVLSKRRLGDVGHILPNRDLGAVAGSEKRSMFHHLRPMLARPAAKPFTSQDWLFEIKWDGYRAIAEVEKGQVKLYSRNGNDFSRKYVVITHALRKISHEVVLDGEICVLDSHGKAKFQNLQYYHEKKQGSLVYIIFDLLYLDGYDLTQVPLLTRKKILEETFSWNETLLYSDHVENTGGGFFQLAKEQGLEGVMAKRAESLYEMGHRSENWLKIKAKHQQEAIICGYTEPRGSRKDLGALILGVYEGGKLTYIGHTGTGFQQKGLTKMKKMLDEYKIPKSPFEVPPKPNAPVQWIKPKFLCVVEFTEWTKDMHMRHPVFLGLREDKKAQEVVREERDNDQKGVREENEGDSGRVPSSLARMTNLTFSNLNKVYWPTEGITKKELIEYYKKVTPIIFPYLKDRPQNLHRFPNGISGSSFYQKDILSHPDWLRTVTVPSESEEKDIHYLVADNPDIILYLANLGCIEMNPWNSRTPRLDFPDYMVIDLDPEDISFEHVIDTAHTVRDLLEKAEIPSYCKTSGATGLHIYIPLGAKYHDDVVRQFAEVLARLAQKNCPEYTSVERSPKKRQKKVYLDFLQNRFGQTLASAYSVRPRVGATVSTPLRWSEVDKSLNPSQFTIKTILKRIEKVGDLFKPVLREGIDIEKSITRIDGLLEGA